VRVPLAAGTLLAAPPTTRISEEALLLMADIWPTGFFGARNGFRLVSDAQPDAAACTVAVVGCGPVGLCAVLAAREFGAGKIIAVDGVADRLASAETLGAVGVSLEDARKAAEELTGGKGIDIVVEAVGLSAALRTAFEIVRPGGAISSVGVHNGEVRFCPKTWSEAVDPS
jgi:threonine dehydrogenase-like Zn-dependent dehydrogenase